MPTLQSVLIAVVITLFATGNAHMIMNTPPSYGSPDKSPLDPSGSNFPCKATSSSGFPVTTIPIGSPQTLSFNGTAVHGGGSCQISLTTDTPATKNSKWMVIHSIEGGCPARNTPGNLPEGANPDTTADPDTYKYSIPAGVAPGAYTLAWTWFNKVGNREMYMNCAAIKVTGGSGKRDVPRNGYEGFSSERMMERAAAGLPDMFVANIGTGCATADGGDLQFPNPGTSVETNTGYKGIAPVGSCGAASAGSASSPSSGTGSSGSGAASAASPSQSASAPATPDSAPAPGSSGNTQPDSSASAASMAAPAAAPSVVAPAVAAPAASNPTSGSGSGASTGSCSSPGQSTCSPDGTEIGMCALGGTVTWTKMAQGTKCVGGSIVAAQ